MLKQVPLGSFLVPHDAKVVFSGQIFTVYQWDQQLFDGKHAVFEMLKRADTLQVIAIRDGKIVVVEDEQPGLPPHLTLPGGRAESDDESWLSAAKRELLEETGMQFKHWRLISVVQPAPKIEWFCPLFLATDLLTVGELKLDSGEKIIVKEMSFDELKNLALSGSEPRLSYLAQVIGKYDSIDDLLVIPDFTGQEIDR